MDDEELKAAIDAAVAEATAGLKKTNVELKAEKAEAKKVAEAMTAQLESLGGEDGVKALVEMRERLAKDETGKLLAEGKHEEWFEQRAASMRADHERKLEMAMATIAEKDEALKGASSKLHSTLLDQGISQACDKSDIKEHAAREHARMLAERTFQFDEELQMHVLRGDDGGVIFGKDAKAPKGFVEWIEEKRETPEYRAWWPSSTSAGLPGNQGPGSNPAGRVEQLGKMDMNAYRKARSAEA